MGLRLKIIKKNQLLIDAELIDFDDNGEKFGKTLGSSLQVSYNLLRLFLSDIKKSKKSNWQDYKDAIETLTDKIQELTQQFQGTGIDKRIISKLLELTLVTSNEVLNKAIQDTENKKEGKQNERFLEILAFQKTVACGLRKFKPEFALTYQTLNERIQEKDVASQETLRLGDIKKEYEAAYTKNHSSGCFGFFKLPIKRFFQQNSRAAELKFLEDVDNYLLTSEESLGLVDRDLMRLSALNLVRLKIETELFGSGSQLHQLIEKRLRDSGYQNDDSIIMGFIDICEGRKISVPPSLKHCYENDLTITSSARSTF